VHDATPTAGVVALLQVVEVNVFPALAVSGVHETTSVGPVVASLQVVVV
jgi:hypothetical protein